MKGILWLFLVLCSTEAGLFLQEATGGRETLLEFCIALMGLLEKVKQQSPHVIPNVEALLRDQFVEHVIDFGLRRELKQLVCRHPSSTLLEVRSEAIS